MKTALIIDDDRNIRTTLVIHLEEIGLVVNAASSGADGLEKFRALRPDLVLLDLKLPDRDGLEVLKEMAADQTQAAIIMITAYAAIDTAVKAIKMGAFDYLPKPFTPAQITRTVEMARHVRSLETEIRTLKGIVQEGGILTRNRRLYKTLQTARQVAEATATVLITGESGTGKGLLAHLIHEWSPRADRPFVVVDCAGLHENLLESDLFGHRKGAFTGALQEKIGKLQRADGGTVFLDEVTEMPPSVQAKLLRFLQDREFEPLGGTHPLQVDVRVIAATNKMIENLVEEDVFRKDLYFRLNVVELHLPPLRERPEDIRILAEHYLKRFAMLNNKAVNGLHASALEALANYSWPGNVRELVNVIERGTILCPDKQLTLEALPAHIARPSAAKGLQSVQSLMELEKDHIRRVLSQTGSMEEAARILGIDPATLWRKRKKYLID